MKSVAVADEDEQVGEETRKSQNRRGDHYSQFMYVPLFSIEQGEG